jgi:hypothetical protein
MFCVFIQAAFFSSLLQQPPERRQHAQSQHNCGDDPEA